MATVSPPQKKRKKKISLRIFLFVRGSNHSKFVSNLTNTLLSKFYELQDFSAEFFIVAAATRKNEFDDKLDASIFNSIKERVNFLDYDKVVKRHEGLSMAKKASW